MAAAAIALISSVVSAAPPLITTIGTLIANLVHKHQAMTVIGATVNDPSLKSGTVMPATGSEKKAAAMNDVSLFVSPLIALVTKLETGKDVDVAGLESTISALIDDFVALNKSLGIFQPATTETAATK